MRVIVSPRARDDIRAIGRYTAHHWGRNQARAYLFKLRARFQSISEHPDLGQAREDIAPGYHSIREGSHFIFYRVNDGTIEIIGLPHAAMDIDTYFDDEQGDM